jgi:hypothetical protein
MAAAAAVAAVAAAAAVAEPAAMLTMQQHTAAAADAHTVGSTGGKRCSQVRGWWLQQEVLWAFLEMQRAKTLLAKTHLRP